MAEKRKSIVDESLLEAQKIQKAFEQNAKEILSNTMGKEIEQLVKESLEEDDEEEVEGVENDEEATDLDLSDEGGEDTEELDLDFGDDESEEGEDNDDLNIDFEDEEGGEDLDLDSEEGEGLDLDSDEGMEDLDLDSEEGEGVDTIDLTGEKDITNIINIYKKMGPEDEIQVVRTGNSIDIKDTRTNSEYRVELGNEGMSDDIMGESVMYEIEIDEDEDFMENEDPMDDDDSISKGGVSDGGFPWNTAKNENDEPMYEIEIEDDEMESDPMDERPMGEAARTLGNGRRFGRNGLDKPRTAPSHLRQENTSPRVSNLLKENSVLKQHINGEKSKVKELMEQNKKLVDALTQLRGNLQEIAVFNSNLTYSVRLMSENTTTKEEKVEIIKRMDSAKNLKESKDVYKSIARELGNKKPLNESINDKLNQTKSSGAQISESKVYVNPELEKMKKLWNFKYNNK